MMTPDPVPPASPEVTTLRDALLRELETALDLELVHFEERACKDASDRLRTVIARLESARAERSRWVPGEEGGEASGLPALSAILRDLADTLSELDFVERLNVVLTDAQVIALEMVRVVPSAPPPGAESGLEEESADLGALRSIGEDLARATKQPYREILERAVGLHAQVASAATRCVHTLRRPWQDADAARASVTGSRGAEADTSGGERSTSSAAPASIAVLEASVAALGDWLASEPLGALRDAIRALLHERAAAEPSQPRKRRPPAVSDVVERIRGRWDREGTPRRVRIEAARLDYLIGIAEFGAFLDGFVEARLLAEADRTARDAISHLAGAIGALRSLHDEARLQFEGSATLVDAEALLKRGLAAIGDLHRNLAELAEGSHALEAATDGAAAITDEIGRLPSELEVGRLIDEGGKASVGDGGVTLAPREWARDAFGVFVLERLREAALPYAGDLRSARDQVPNARTVLDYNLGAAIDIVRESVEGADTMRRELVLGGLDRTADRLEEVMGRLEQSRREAPLAAQLVLDGATEEFWRRARAEESLEGRARDIWATLSQGAGRAGSWAGRRGAGVLRSATALFRQGSARALVTLRRARLAVGVDPVAAERVEATVRVIADVDAAASDLPFVYRRLFSYRAIADASLLAGRGQALAALDAHLQRWRAGAPEVLLLTGSTGVGLSSLMNVTRGRWADDVEWCPIALSERATDEAGWSRKLGEALGIEGDVDSLDDLRARLEARPEPPLPQVCVIDNFELLYRRGVLDSGLIGRTMQLMSATDTCVLWIGVLASSAWQVLVALNPGVSALARVLAIDPLGRDDLEEAILARHQRSGIPLHMEVPDEPPIGIRRALTRAKTDDERQRMLRASFFDRLHELSDGYVALAILYWLRSSRLEPDTEVMHLGWPDSIDFAAWDDLEATGAFALRAFLEHGSLTLEEYRQVFGVGPEQAVAAFERLGNLLLIEPTGSTRTIGTRLRFRRIRPTCRYHVRPVLVRPVERLLVARRLLY